MSLHRCLLVALVVVVALSSLAARAQTDVVVAADDVRPLQHTLVDFSNVLVEAQRTGPNTDFFLARRKVGFRNLIALRGSFRAELQRSAAAVSTP